jgi:DNA polymerase-4
MPSARARRLCPDGAFLAPDFAYYREASREVMEIVRAHVETVEVVGLDEAYMELTGLPAPHASMRRVSEEIEAHTGLGCSIGIGPSKLVAKVASDAEKPRGFVVLSREQAGARFQDARCGMVPGIGPKTVERLRAIGIDTLGKLAAAPERTLAQRFGSRQAAELRRRARFEDDAPVTEERKVISESRELTFDHDIAELGRLETILSRLVVELCTTLAVRRRCGRTIGIKIRLDDFSTHTRARTLPEPVSAAERVGPVALDLLRRFAPPRPVRLLGVRVAGLEPSDATADEQLTLAV